MTSRRARRSRFWVAFLLVIALTLGFTTQALANLTGSKFESADGNLIVSNAGNEDWANAPSLVTGPDQPSGSTDNAFGQGTKEDNPSVTIVDGSIPPNKNDLTRFYVSSEFVNGNNFLYLAWERAVNIGNANIDFEINQNATTGFTGSTTGPITLNRTPGDILITYDFPGSGAPDLGLLTWMTGTATSGNSIICFSSGKPAPAGTSCWANRVDLTTAGSAEGAVNTASVSEPFLGSSLGIGLFGEAGINLTAAGVFPSGTCRAFGSTFVKSRSSSSFGAEMKDFIAPQPVNISNCGEVKIIKHTDPRGINQSFNYTSTIPVNGSFSLNDNGNTSSDSAGNTYDNKFVPVGSYTVTEGAEPANFALESLSCTGTGGSSGTQHAAGSPQADLTVTANGVVTCTYTNLQQLGAIKITKQSTKNATGLSGATFTVTGTGVNRTLTTGSGGTACIDNLPFGGYTVTETGAPTGYKIDNASGVTVTVDHNASCSSGTPNAPAVFTDTPLSQITVSFKSLAGAGVTTATILCTGDLSAQALPEGSPRTLGNGTSTLVPGTYSCTVVVDP